MNNQIIRLQNINIKNFKNIENGTIDFPNSKKNCDANISSEIIGLYGQNGSGKTALIEALKILKYVMSGESLPEETYDLIHCASRYSTLAFTFYAANNENEDKYQLLYEFTIEKETEESERNSVIVTEEKLSFKRFIDEKWTYIKDIIIHDFEDKNILFKPKKNLNKFNDKEIEDLTFAKKFARKTNKSFIFSKDSEDIFKQNNSFVPYYNLINLLKFFAQINLCIIDNNHSGLISANIAIPFNFRYSENGTLSHGDLGISLSEPSIIPINHFELVSKIIKQMNIVLKKIIPELEIKIKEYGGQLTRNNQDGIRFELISKRGDTEIALKYESEGIKKVISILSTLIAVYKNPSFCLVVDELDAGIFEYLLGEILDILSKFGKGQLVFTSHNLRPLEILKSDSIIFTTVNPKNKFIKFSNIKNNNNLRSVYMRSLILGGQAEIVYEETNSYEIRRAFKKAGRFANVQD